MVLFVELLIRFIRLVLLAISPIGVVKENVAIYVVNFKVRMNCFEFQLDYFTNSEAIAIVSTLVFWCWHQHYKFN